MDFIKKNQNIILLALAIGAGYWLYTNNKKKNAMTQTPAVPTVAPTSTVA